MRRLGQRLVTSMAMALSPGWSWGSMRATEGGSPEGLHGDAVDGDGGDLADVA